MQQVAIKKLNMIILMQPNVEAAIAFYQQLGLELAFHLKDKWAEMRLGDVKIGLCPTSEVISEAELGRRTGVVLEVEDARLAYDLFKSSVTFLAEPKEAVHGIMVSFRDPGGNVLDLYQPTPEKVIALARKVKETPGGCCRKDGSRCECKKACKVAAKSDTELVS